MSSQDRFNHARNVASKWLAFTDDDKAVYLKRYGYKLTACRFAAAKNNDIPLSTMMNAVNAIKSNKQGSGFGGQQIFTDAEEDSLYAYICTATTHGELLTQHELIVFASKMLKDLRPELSKSIVELKKAFK